MPTIARPCSNHKIKLCIYADHAPPHFHLEGPDWEALIDLRTFQILEGSAPTAVLREVKEYWAANLEHLWSEWRRINENE